MIPLQIDLMKRMAPSGGPFVCGMTLLLVMMATAVEVKDSAGCDEACVIAKVVTRDGAIACPTGFTDISDRKKYVKEVGGGSVNNLKVVVRTLGCKCSAGCDCTLKGEKNIGYTAEFRATTVVGTDPNAKVSKKDKVKATAVMQKEFQDVYLVNRMSQAKKLEAKCDQAGKKAKAEFMKNPSAGCCKLPTKSPTKACPYGNQRY